jgi:hypothetical protein
VAIHAETAPLGNGDRLRGALALVGAESTRACAQLFGHPRIRELYPDYLFMLHCLIRASVPLMETARARALELAPGDAVAAGLANYLDGHIDEERDHDEWLLDDLEVIGVPRADVLGRPPSPTVASAVGAQYYWVLHHHPVALLGWIGLLEGYPPDPATIDGIQARTGYPDEAFRTLRAHAELDQEHGDELFEALDALPLSEAHATAIGLNGMWSLHLLATAIGEVADRAGG